MRMLPFVAALLGVAGQGAAQSPGPARYSVETLADGVHAVIYNPERDVQGNTLIVINDEDVVVVDANAGTTTARATIAEIRKLTAKPVRYVINTHWHDDHVYGNQAYADAYPGVEFIAHPLTRQDIADHAFASNGFVVDLIADDVTRLEGYLETGRYRDGRAVEGELETRIRTYLASRREELADRRTSRAVVPTVEVADTRVLRRGPREIQIRYLGRGNTRGDLIVYLPAERIVATGDLVVYPVPYATNVYAREWVATLDALMTLPAAAVLPGHGPVMRDWNYVKQVKDALARHLAAVAEAKKDELSLAQTQERVQLPEVRAAFVRDNPARRDGYEAFFRPTLIRNAWEELDPEIMNAYRQAPPRRAAAGVYTLLAPASAEGLTAVINEKDVMLITSLTRTAAAHAANRALRELTSKPVKYLVATGAGSQQKDALAVLRASYPQGELQEPPDGETRTLQPDGREIRLVRRNGSIVVELPSERIRIVRGGAAERMH